MGGKVTLEFDNIANEFVYLENIIINAYVCSDILGSHGFYVIKTDQN